MLYFLTIAIAGIYFIPIGIVIGLKLIQYKIWLDHSVWISNPKDLKNLINKNGRTNENNRY